MTTISALELIRAHRWSRLFFTTYALSLSFFEAVILDAIVRQDIRSCTILTDVSGVRAAMEELGTQAAGKMYDIEPVAVNKGVFHPKLLALSSNTESHLVIGSGNLTFGGWGSNLECLEHLHPSFAADAFDDAAGFFEEMAAARDVRHAAQQECAELADDLRTRVRREARTGNIRLLHSLGPSILDQLQILTDDLGGADRIVIASPFFDKGGVETICLRLGLDHAYVHVHDGGTVFGSAGSNWPDGSTHEVKPIKLEILCENPPRLLHAKMFEVMCRHGRVVLSGSANATIAGLGAGRNVELCVARIQRSPVIGWRFSDSHAPALTALSSTDELQTETVAVLRATFEGGEVQGIVINTFPVGAAVAYRRQGIGWKDFGTVLVGPEGAFSFKAPQQWKDALNDQLILRLVSKGSKAAQGFVSLPEMREISRRLGASAPSFFSLLRSNETPDDVAAIMDFFREHPDWLPVKSLRPSGGSEVKPEGAVIVDVEGLLDPGSVVHDRDQTDGTNSPGWVRFMQDVLAAFSEARGTIEANDVTNDREDSTQANLDERDKAAAKRATTIENAAQSFEMLLDRWLGLPPERRDPVRAFVIAQYICERLELESFRVQSYLDRLVESFAACRVEPEDRELSIAAALLWGTQLEGGIVRTALMLRRQLLRMGCILPRPLPDLSLVQGFARRLILHTESSKLWNRACSTRTAQEEVKLFWSATNIPLSAADFPALSSAPEWQELKNGKSSRTIPMSECLTYCPHCWLILPSVEVDRLRNSAIATSFCGRILLCEEI
jgi:hypothetical protein